MHLRKLLPALVVVPALTSACGSSSSSPAPGPAPGPTQNTVPVVVNAGPAGDYANGLFASVTVCAPGSTSNCQTIGGILVDTGSSGLRMLSSAMSSSLVAALPQQTSNGNPVIECAQFQDGFTWGPVQSADISMAGERASAVPIQVIGTPNAPAVPASCSSAGPPEDTLAALGANGVLGVGVFRQDCGPGCAVSGSSNPGFYYACPSSGCQIIAEGINQQLQNPVWLFTGDNNGVVIALPSISAPGAATVSGTMIFGIGTQSNNALGSATVQTTTGDGSFTVSFQNKPYTESFIDSGTNGIFFLDAATTGLPLCPDSKDFYCPASPQTLNATNVGANNTNKAISFSITNADTFLNNPMLFASPTLGGPNPGSFDWGLPFFFGKTIFTAIEGQNSPGGFGPYWAY
jgi:hypothetical protein